MKKRCFIISICLMASILLTAQVSKTVNVTTPGKLTAALTTVERTTVTNLIVTGVIDARDFKFMRDSLSMLSILDINGVTVAAYTGTGVMYSTISTTYAENEIPAHAVNSKLTSIILPSAITSIKASAFSGCTNLTSITIPSSITTINPSTFSGCSSLITIVLPPSLTNIGGEAFRECTSLTAINIPASVIKIDSMAFMDCSGLITVDENNPNYSSQNGLLFNKQKTILIQCPNSIIGNYTIPASITSISTGAFSYCTGLTSIAIPNSVASIGNYAFYNCTGLSSIQIPSSVNYIGLLAFYGCSQAIMINIDAANQYYSIEDGVLFNKNKTILYACPDSKVGSYSIPSTVTTIGVCAFYFCSGLTSLTIPSSVSSIGESAFTCCWGLVLISAQPIIPVELTGYEVYGVEFDNCILLVPDGSKNAYAVAQGWKGFKNIISNSEYTPKRTLSCTSGSLSSKFAPIQMQITKDLTVTGTIDARDFKFMRDSLALEKLDLSGATIAAYTGTLGTAGTTSTTYRANEIPQKAFYTSNGNTHLTNVIFPETATAIASYAFANCTGLTNINTTASMNIMGYAFSNCTGLNSATIAYGNNNIFTGCANLATIYIPNGLVNIDYEAFKDLKTIKKVIIPSTVTGIDDYAFSGCELLDSIDIPATITSVGDWAFAECGEVNVDAANTNFSSASGVLFNKNKKVLFHAPASLISYIIPPTVTTIKNAAFYNNGNLKTITIPTSVLSIGEYAFAYCEKLAGVSFSSVILVGKYAFYGCYGLSEIVIPVSVSTIGKCAFFECVNIISITAMNLTPVELETIIASEDNDVFGGIDKTTCILYVPKGTKTLYKVANQWKDFLVISEIDNTGVPKLLNKSISFYPNPILDIFHIAGISGTANLQMLDLNGRVVLSRQVTNNESVSIGFLRQGLYILKLTTAEGAVEQKVIKR